MKMKNKLLKKKIIYIKLINKLLLNVKKDFFNISFKITNFNNIKTL